MLTRKHFILAARLIAALDNANDRANAIDSSIRIFAVQSRRFDADRFRAFVDCERSRIVADRVAAMARASRAA